MAIQFSSMYCCLNHIKPKGRLKHSKVGISCSECKFKNQEKPFTNIIYTKVEKNFVAKGRVTHK